MLGSGNNSQNLAKQCQQEEQRKSGKWETNNGVIWHSYNGAGKRAKTNRLAKNWFDMK